MGFHWEGMRAVPKLYLAFLPWLQAAQIYPHLYLRLQS